MTNLNEDANNASMSNGSQENKINNESYIERLEKEVFVRKFEMETMRDKLSQNKDEEMNNLLKFIDDSPYFYYELKFKNLMRLLNQINQLVDYVEEDKKAIDEYSNVFLTRMDVKGEIFQIYKKISKMNFY
ncbi:MAG: hypothetical protein PHY75_04550 [Bacteroidales bacterium]|nr:hypothetical protein [Bacteroidales bacterium]